jgi:hypothetical protein
MKIITQVAKAMQWLLGPESDRLALESGFTQRSSKVTGSVFMQSLTFSSMEKGAVGYSDLVAAAWNAGVAVSKQGLEQRFSPRSAELSRQVLERGLEIAIASERRVLPILARFAGVYLRDSTVIPLPKALEAIWPGSSSSHGTRAGLKLHVRLEVCSGQLAGPILAAGRAHDSSSPFQSEVLPVGAVRIGDLGFYALKQFAADSRAGVYWLSRYKASTLLYDAQGQRIDLLAWLSAQPEGQFERPVWLGHKKLACRLLVERVPEQVVEQRRRRLREYARKKQVPLPEYLLQLAQWTLLLTNIPTEWLSLPEAFVLMHVRWQIELLFKRWKSIFLVDEWRSTDPWRILTELYAKLLAILIAHWCVLTSAWQTARPSFWQATRVVQRFASHLAIALNDLPALLAVLFRIEQAVIAFCHMGSRNDRPPLFRLLEHAACTTLA